MKVILKKELIDYPANDDMCASLCDFTKKLNSRFLPKSGQSQLRDYMKANQAWSNCILRLELDYTLKPSEAEAAVKKIFDEAEDYDDYMYAYVTEKNVRCAGAYVKDNDIEVTGCRFTIIDENEDHPAISDKERQAVREYFASLGYPEDAKTPDEVICFIERLRQDIPEIDDIVEIASNR